MERIREKEECDEKETPKNQPIVQINDTDKNAIGIGISSLKVNVEGNVFVEVQPVLGEVVSAEKNSKESYKSIPKEKLVIKSDDIKDTGVKMVQEEDTIHDGADEKMLNGDDQEKLTEKKEEVKFITGDHQNGDAKIDIGSVNAKAFTGMTKDELMKYANDPFWIRLRWIFFILFWAAWVGMLVGAILIIINAPKCAAPEPLPWFKKGPLAKLQSTEVSTTDLENAQRAYATGVIYELPAEETYRVKEPAVEDKIRKIVDNYKSTQINVILDITPNYVTKESNLMKQALVDETKRSAFIWIEKPEVPNNWLSIVNGSAWDEVQPGNYVLSQFGDGKYDLNMNDSLVKTELKGVFQHLIHLGVKGFRLNNAKFFILTQSLQNELPNSNPEYIHTQYGFWTHSQTTFQEGLGDVLLEYTLAIKNASNFEAFLSVAEDTIRPDVFKTKSDEFGIDLPMYGPFTEQLATAINRDVFASLSNTLDTIKPPNWQQWNYQFDKLSPQVDPSAYNLFLSLLPGVPVIPVGSPVFQNIAANSLEHIDKLRSSPSYMHGDFALYKSGSLIAYSRIKSGNPGYFVVYNPTEEVLVGNFASVGLPEKMTVDILSNKYNYTGIVEKSKVLTNEVPMSPYSAFVLTYVPVK